MTNGDRGRFISEQRRAEQRMSRAGRRQKNRVGRSAWSSPTFGTALPFRRIPRNTITASWKPS